MMGSFAYFGTLLETVSKAISLQDYAHAVIVIFQCLLLWNSGTENWSWETGRRLGIYFERWERWVGTLIDSHHNSLDGADRLQLVFSKFLLLLFVFLSASFSFFFSFFFCIKRASFALHATQKSSSSWVEFLKSVQRRRRQPHQLLVQREWVSVPVWRPPRSSIFTTKVAPRSGCSRSLAISLSLSPEKRAPCLTSQVSVLQIRKMLHENQ